MDQLEEKKDNITKQMEEIQGMAAQRSIVPVSPINLNTSPTIQQYGALLGYGVSGPQENLSNLIEAGRLDSMGRNSNIVCYNCKTPRHYVS